MTEQDYKDKKVLVAGLGLSGGGVGVARFLAKSGAKVTVMDQKTRKQLKPALLELEGLKIKYVFGKTNLELLKKTDLLVVNPAIDLRSRLVVAAKKKGIPIDSELGIFVQHCKSRIIAITGTKGKSTVTQLVYEMLKNSDRDVIVGGNIGGSLLDRMDEISERAYVVLEVSSFQLDLFHETGMEFKPWIAVITNILKDHLDRYASPRAYAKSKLSIMKYQGRGDVAILHEDLKVSAKKFKVKKIFFSGKLPRFLKAGDIGLVGKHNIGNIIVANEIARLLHVGVSVFKETVRQFRGLEHRLEFVRYIRGVQFYNDSTSTTPISTKVALESFPRKVILIAGGVNKNLPLTDLGRVAAKNTKAVFLIGKSAKEIKRAISKYDNKKTISIEPALKNAVKAAFKLATIGDIIIFSPACASFDMFENAKARGSEFKTLVENLVKS